MINKNVIRIGTFFSGIGSAEKALERLKKEGHIQDCEVKFFSEIDKNAIKSYCAIHNIDGRLNLGSIIDIRGVDLPICDLWAGGFPCQDISCDGKMRGFEFDSSTRSSLGWEMIRLLREVKEKPKYVIFENVAMITSKRFKHTLDLFKQDLTGLVYTLYDDVLNASDYGIPQARKRYFLIAILDDSKKFKFPRKIMSDIKLKDLLEQKIDEKYYLTNSDYIKLNNKLVFKHKNREGIEYEVDEDKILLGGICGIDRHSSFVSSLRLFSIYGNSSTLTACNTSDGCKIVTEN